MKFFLMSSFSVLKNFSMATFNIPAIYRNLFVAEFSKCLAVPDCNALLILSLFIRLAAVLYSPSKCWITRWPRAFTAGFFITFLTKSNSPWPLCQPLLLLLLFLGAALWVYIRLIVTFAGNWYLETHLYHTTKVCPLGNITLFWMRLISSWRNYLFVSF